MTTRRHENLHFSRGFHPSPPSDGAKGEKSAYLSGNPTPSANCLCWRRGWYCEIVLDVRAFLALRQWPSLAEGLPSGGSPQSKINPWEDVVSAVCASRGRP